MLSEFLIIPILAVIPWFIDKGSLGDNRNLVIRAMGGLPGMYYGFLVGSEMRSGFAGPLGELLGIIVLFLLGGLLGVKLGPFLGERITSVLRIDSV
jgi:hypothetical protein